MFFFFFVRNKKPSFPFQYNEREELNVKRVAAVQSKRQQNSAAEVQVSIVFDFKKKNNL